MATYDANKQYKWEETDKFVFNGNQFGLMLNAFRNALSTPEAQQLMLTMKAETEMTKILADAVEDGLVKEVKPEPIADEGPRAPKKAPKKALKKA